MKTKTNVKAGGQNLNHSESLRGIAMRTKVKAGEPPERLSANHSETLSGLHMKTTVRAGGSTMQHNETVSGLKTRTGAKAKIVLNHNKSMR